MEGSVARDMWKVFEPYHAVVYFAPEAKGAYEAVGCKGYWMGYFASRSAAFGAASAELVEATFYNFAPPMVRRAIPDAWTLSSPEQVLQARHELADLSTRRLIAGADVTDAADGAEAVARAASPQGRPLFAAHASLPWPELPHMRLWHAATLLREHRGDGHVALLMSEGIDGCEAHVISAAAGAVDAERQRQNRGWTEDEWADATERLRARGLLDGAGVFTEAGRELKQHLEDRTDALALGPYAAVGTDACERLLTQMRALYEPRAAVPYPNAMGVTS